MILILLNDGTYQTFMDFEDNKCKKFCKELIMKNQHIGSEILMGNLLTFKINANDYNLYQNYKNIIIVGEKYKLFYYDIAGARSYINHLSEEELESAYLIQGDIGDKFELWQYDIPVGTEVCCYPERKVGKIVQRIFEPAIGIRYICEDLEGNTFVGYDNSFQRLSTTEDDNNIESAKLFETHQMLTISTGHITPETNELMLNQTEFEGITYYPKDVYGYFIMVHIDDAEDYKNIPCDLMELLYFAKDYGYDMLCLDSDGPVMSDYGLQMYHWL
ncbi:MAG: hypothetical protein UHN47_07205 [Lachnospiraceae bacterium]|nr:hypothetical protein [Lachnospiraceae bacterium]